VLCEDSVRSSSSLELCFVKVYGVKKEDIWKMGGCLNRSDIGTVRCDTFRKGDIRTIRGPDRTP
jgi:hypothetical protein